MKNSKIWQLPVLLFSAFLVITSCDDNENTVYELKFDITVPDTWSSTEYIYDDVYRYYAVSPERDEDDELYLTEPANANDTIREDILIYRLAYTPSSMDSLNDFYYAIMGELNQLTNYQSIWNTGSDTMINGEPARKIIHTQTVRLPYATVANDSFDLDIKPIKFLFYHHGYGYVVDCSTLDYTYSYYKPIFEETIIPTFEFIK